jgi:hypothetical protein
MRGQMRAAASPLTASVSVRKKVVDRPSFQTLCVLASGREILLRLGVSVSKLPAFPPFSPLALALTLTLF